MEKNRAELNEKLKKISYVHIFAYEVYLHAEYFHKPKTKEELDLVAYSIHSKNLRFIMHLMYRVLINEVAKLYSRSKNDKYRIEAFIRLFAIDGHFKEINIPIEKVKYWENKLIEQEETIKNVLLLRSKLYAHTDNPLESYANIEVSFKEIKKLLDFVAEILQYIYSTIFDTELLIEPTIFDRDKFLILDLLARGEKKRQDDITELYNGVI